MRSSRGFTFIEVLVALLILTFIVTTSVTVFFARQKRLRQADDLIVAYQILANEAEVQRHLPYDSLAPKSVQPFRSDLSIGSTLRHLEGAVTVVQVNGDEKRLDLQLTWAPERKAALSVYRSRVQRGSVW